MKTYLDCFPCFLNQALRAARAATDDEEKIKTVLDEVCVMLKETPLQRPPPKTARQVYQKIAEVTGNPDPFAKLKDQNTQKALSLYPAMRNRLAQTDDRLLMAIRMAIAGNTIDFGPQRSFDIEKEIAESLDTGFGICDYDQFKNRLEDAPEILYIGDNAGEAVFDRILIEEMKKPVIYIVRDRPVINDVTFRDALAAGLADVATLLSSGTDAPGTLLETCSTEFKRIYTSARLIISKGQGNYEALSDETRPIFFLLKVKCPVIARDIGAKEGDMVLKGTNDACKSEPAF